MNIKKIILILLITQILILPIVISEDEAQRTAELRRIESQLDFSTPTFTNIQTTVYFTPSCQDKNNNWCSPTKGSCFTSTQEILDFYEGNENVRSCVQDRNAGWCCIPESARGMYEEIKCQGSGVCELCQGDICQQKVYHHSNIQPTQQDSIPQDPRFTRGITSRQTNPTPKRTVAVNPVPGTPGYIPYGTTMYIFWGPNNPWNGIYVAEDTGSAFRGQRKMDIYAGVGNRARDEALAAGLSGAYPQIFLLDSELNIIDGTSIGIPPTTGEYKVPYANQITYQEPIQIFQRAYEIVEKSTTITTYEQLLQTFQENQYNFCPIHQSEQIIEQETTERLVIYDVQLTSTSTPIYYTYNGQEWIWSPDRENWMTTQQLTVIGGRFNGRQPITQQRTLINKLNPIKQNLFLGQNLILETNQTIFLVYYDSEPIYLRFMQNTWRWGFDRINWMNLNETTKTQGEFTDKQLQEKYLELIKKLEPLQSQQTRGTALITGQDPTQSENILLLFQIADCITQINQCHCQIKFDGTHNISIKNNETYINDEHFKTFFNLTRNQQQNNFEFIFKDTFYIFINDTENKLITQQELEEEAQKIIDELENDLNPNTLIENLIEDITGINMFQELPFLNPAGFLNPASFGLSIFITPQYNFINFIEGKNIRQLRETILNPSWLLEPENEESPIPICLAKRQHFLVCDDLTELDFAIRLTNLE